VSLRELNLREPNGDTGEILRPGRDVIARNLGESAVLIHLNTNNIYELNATGARIWELVSNGATRQHIVDVLAQEFEDTDIARAVDEMIEMLRIEGLV